MRQKRSMFVLLAVFLLLFCIHSIGMAQSKRGTEIKLKDIRVVGKIQKPQAFYALHRAPLNYKNFQMKRNYIQKVIEAVKKQPF